MKGLEWAARIKAAERPSVLSDSKEIERLAADIRQKQKQLDEALKEAERRAGKV